MTRDPRSERDPRTDLRVGDVLTFVVLRCVSNWDRESETIVYAGNDIERARAAYAAIDDECLRDVSPDWQEWIDGVECGLSDLVLLKTWARDAQIVTVAKEGNDVEA